VTGDEIVRRIASRYPTRFLRGYAGGKLRRDPVYAAVLARIDDHPLFDLGCGTGLLELYLREHGKVQPIVGVDHDVSKIGVARSVTADYRDLTFRVGDIREPIPRGMSVVALDVLHYFRDGEQEGILRGIAEAVPPGGMAIIRDCVRDGSWRYRVTALQEMFSRAIRWLEAERLHFPRRETIVAPFREKGFLEEIAPLWGATPFNNYLFVFRRPSSGTTKR
jgi:SAM-dependent methyltransferase